MFEGALTAGICSMGVDVLLVGPMPTPAIAFLTRSFRADAGVVISASHNLFEDNGIKFFSEDGFKLPDDYELEIERLIYSGEIDNLRPVGEGLGKAFRIDDAEGRYIEFVKNSIPKGLDFEGIQAVVDCANGASYKITPTVLRELGADIITTNTFRTNPAALLKSGINDLSVYVSEAVSLAKQATEGKKVLIAGSNPPAL